MISRTAYCLDKLRLDEGIGAPTIYKRICENQYERFGLRCVSYETVRDYFRLRESPGVDPPLINDPSNDPPWLFALELEFPGSTDAFFHPAFDLLWGQVESRHYWGERVQRIPSEWIEEARSNGRLEDAAEWMTLNSALSKRGRRNKVASSPPPLRVAHIAMLRLPQEYREALFKSIRNTGFVSRRLGNVDVERKFCLERISMDSLAALLALLLEANCMTAWDRFHEIRRAMKVLLPQVAKLPECKRIEEALLIAVEGFNRGMAPYQNQDDRFYYGKPRSWLCHLAPPVSHYFEEIFGHPPE